MKVNVLGTEYEVVMSNVEDMPDVFDDRDGDIDETIKRIRIDDYSTSEGDSKCIAKREFLIDKNIRHELVHAFLFESGLAENTDWARNEEMVDWIARQFPKMLKAFKEADAL